MVVEVPVLASYPVMGVCVLHTSEQRGGWHHSGVRLGRAALTCHHLVREPLAALGAVAHPCSGAPGGAATACDQQLRYCPEGAVGSGDPPAPLGSR